LNHTRKHSGDKYHQRFAKASASCRFEIGPAFRHRFENRRAMLLDCTKSRRHAVAEIAQLCRSGCTLAAGQCDFAGEDLQTGRDGRTWCL